MGKRRHGPAGPGSLFRSLPESIKAELGLGIPITVGKNSTKSSPAGKRSGSSRRDAIRFLSTQPDDLDTSGESDAIERTLMHSEEMDLPTTDLMEEEPTKSVSTSVVVPAPSARAPSVTRDDSPMPRKRQKLDDRQTYSGLLPYRLRHLDASALVPHYKRKGDMPAQVQKWFPRRHTLFSQYDRGCLLDEVGWFSVTPEQIADQIAERCRCDTVLDAFCGVGGNAIAFARTCERVIAIDNSPVRLALARHNAAIYGVADRIEFILSDYPTFVQSYVQLPAGDPKRRKIDVVFLSPPWGGPEYNKPAEGEEEADKKAAYHLDAIGPVHGKELFDISRKITLNVAYYLPRHVEVREVSALLDKDGAEAVEIEEEWMGNRLTALTCYFGGLAEGQEHLFEPVSDV